MSSIGVIVHASPNTGQLDADWRPTPLGTRPQVHAVIYDLTGVTTRTQRFDLRPSGIALELEVGAEEPPLSVTASGVFDDAAITMLKKLCTGFGARFYDSEEGRFVI
ncbi:hypothetical protein ACSFA0_26180 [Variovorax sp. LT1P1]|uniref:hypothetical protein n=1 Tax=Variovorax sp. LT1P1 TaxID=3443730 RepID=UPI003F483BCE